MSKNKTHKRNPAHNTKLTTHTDKPHKFKTVHFAEDTKAYEQYCISEIVILTVRPKMTIFHYIQTSVNPTQLMTLWFLTTKSQRSNLHTPRWQKDCGFLGYN